jgi:tetratricopeptide (TPR) repeat protein
MRPTRLSAVLAVAVVLGGCLTPPPPPPQPPKPVTPPSTVTVLPRKPADQIAAQTALDKGIALYNDGDYNGAIKHLLNANEVWISEKSFQLDALKYMAFSYCVSGRTALCKQQFDKALKIDPNFDLQPGEKGHPLWGPVFQRAKKGAH